ncbi:MAG: OmpA family protein [Thiothrix sp.]|uniref:OmpA family protein n=1 Tax=Thiothrix sp. TaxID=1032 RepID=UPI0026148FCF|nr:OmpA family protein [Thiothrix sp.]MDD5392248.1 OmpA family protein [Thiothrix sp.]
MSDSTLDNDDLTPTQEYGIAGIVILLFGLLYWFLNGGWNPAPVTPLTVAQAPKAELAAPAPPAVAAIQAEAPKPKAATAPKPVTPVQAAAPKAVATPPQPAQTIAISSSEAAFKENLANNVHDKPVTFGDIRFEQGSTNIKAESDHQIRAIAALLQQYPKTRVLIRGHTDKTEVSNSDAQLSLMRANAMGLALVNFGIERRRISIMGMGDTAPIDTNATEEGRKNNRRIDLSIIE